MRCLSCDRRLNDRESTRKYASSGTFVDLCNRCFASVADEIPDIEGEGIVISGEEYDELAEDQERVYNLPFEFGEGPDDQAE